MPDTWFNVKKIISFIVFIVVFSLMGLATGRPVMILAYAAFFIAVAFILLMLMRKRQRHSELTDTVSPMVHKIIGGVLLLLAVVLPALIITRSNLVNLPVLNTVIVLLILGITILFIALMILAAYLINEKGDNVVMSIAGYLLIIVVSAVPGLIMSGIDRTTTGIGSVYYVALAVLIIAWNGYGLAFSKD